jgi:hypothetical protein
MIRFIRFVPARRHPDSGVEDGFFRLAYALRDPPRSRQLTETSSLRTSLV